MFRPEIFVPMFLFLIPIVVILTRHQQKMTELMHRGSLPQPHQTNGDLQSIQYDVQQLKSMVSTLAMSVDSLKDEVRSSNSIQDRVKIGE
jgi:uncharacterized protein YlxW (UPF0749 family)